MRGSKDISDVSNSASFYALICLIVVFVVIVTYGWSTMLTSAVVLPYGWPWPEVLSPIFTILRYVAATAIAVAGVILAKAIAAERIRIALEETPKFVNTWKAYFFVLLVVSALGTMNTMFMTTLQTSVLSDTISQTRKHLQELTFKVDEKLATPDYDKQRSEIKQLFENFEKELRNPANCGFGAQSNLRFRELQQVLPKLKPLALGSGACQNVNALIADYRDTVDKLADDLPVPAIKKRFAQRKILTEQIKKKIGELEEMGVKSQNLDKDVVLPVLRSAWSIYAQTLEEAQLLAGTSFEMPSDIVNKNVQGMGGISQIIPLLSKQLDNPLTYLIIVAAILFDVLLVEFFSRHLHGGVYTRNKNFYTEQSSSVSGRDSNLFEN